jgi:hypothetical protein
LQAGTFSAEHFFENGSDRRRPDRGPTRGGHGPGAGAENLRLSGRGQPGAVRRCAEKRSEGDARSFGQGRKQIQSGDPKEDEEARNNFVQKFQVMHRLVEEPNATTTLYIGAENWPMTISLVNRAGKWYFDTDGARQEIVFRRVGKNELSAIRVCAELAAAEKNYFSKNKEYADRFVSDDGKQNGLYWPTTGTQGESPIGPLVANAGSLSGLTMDSGAEPFRGYFFRILDRQGGKATGGSLNYVADGKMTKGFAFVAYPAVYRDSGVMTFIVSQDGVVYEKDLGKQTVDKAKAMKSYDPDQTWKKSDEPEQSAANQKPE